MIKNNLSKLIADRNLNINQLSKETGISRKSLTQLSNNESAGIKFETVETLMHYFGINLTEFFVSGSSNIEVYVQVLPKTEYTNFFNNDEIQSFLENIPVILDVCFIRDDYNGKNCYHSLIGINVRIKMGIFNNISPINEFSFLSINVENKIPTTSYIYKDWALNGTYNHVWFDSKMNNKFFREVFTLDKSENSTMGKSFSTHLAFVASSYIGTHKEILEKTTDFNLIDAAQSISNKKRALDNIQYYRYIILDWVRSPSDQITESAIDIMANHKLPIIYSTDLEKGRANFRSSLKIKGYSFKLYDYLNGEIDTID